MAVDGRDVGGALISGGVEAGGGVGATKEMLVFRMGGRHPFAARTGDAWPRMRKPARAVGSE